jgi:hypothetical protein
MLYYFSHNLALLFIDNDVKNWEEKVVNFLVSFKSYDLSAIDVAGKISLLQKKIDPNNWLTADAILMEVGGIVFSSRASKVIEHIDRHTKQIDYR